jgi:hypothetical protein
MLGDKDEMGIDDMLADTDKVRADLESLRGDTGDIRTLTFQELANTIAKARRLAKALVEAKKAFAAATQTSANIATASATNTVAWQVMRTIT